VTGSRFLLESGSARVLVDVLRLRLREELSIEAFAAEHLQTVELSGGTRHATAEPTLG
jgi:hypothetical protein